MNRATRQGGTHIYNVYIVRGSIERGGSQRELVYRRRAKATSRLGALRRRLPEIRRQVLSKIEDPTIKYVSVYVGRKGSVTGAAFRMRPIQVVVNTGQIR